MGFLSIFFGSTVFMWVLTIVFAAVCLRCLIYGAIGGTSTVLRIICTVVFAALAYYCWKNTGSIHNSNVIDRFVVDSFSDIKHVISLIKNKVF